MTATDSCQSPLESSERLSLPADENDPFQHRW